MNGKIVKISGPLIVADGLTGARMYDVVRVGQAGVIGEIIELHGDRAYIQVYEDSCGLAEGEPVAGSGEPLSLELGPGLIGEIFDGIQRPLRAIRELAGDRIPRGIRVPSLDRNRRWKFVPARRVGETVREGELLGTVAENEVFTHRILVPPGVGGRLRGIDAGEMRVEDPVAEIESEGRTVRVTMLQKWPVRVPRPYRRKQTPDTIMVTGQRVIDTFFPIARGGTAAVPGPFGSGKTVVQHQLAKWADADVIVYVGCGERGNEMTDVLNEFPALRDPRTGDSLMKRTVLVANTSDMPVAAREASVYTGMTIAEYFRDMGLNVALMADSTSRWAEALRETGGRLHEMPGEEGYPAYLSTRLAEFYERAGSVTLLDGEHRGSVTAIGAVSPQGGDLSEPVSQATLRIVKAFWGLSSALAYQRHFPAVDWKASHSLYAQRLSDCFARIAEDFPVLRDRALALLDRETELNEIVRLIGYDALSPEDLLTLETAKSVREDFLHQNAFHETDTYTPLRLQYRLLRCILRFHDAAGKALLAGEELSALLKEPVRREIASLKYERRESAFDAAEQKIGRLAGRRSE